MSKIPNEYLSQSIIDNAVAIGVREHDDNELIVVTRIELYDEDEQESYSRLVRLRYELRVIEWEATVTVSAAFVDSYDAEEEDIGGIPGNELSLMDDEEFELCQCAIHPELVAFWQRAYQRMRAMAFRQDNDKRRMLCEVLTEGYQQSKQGKFDPRHIQEKISRSDEEGLDEEEEGGIPDDDKLS